MKSKTDKTLLLYILPFDLQFDRPLLKGKSVDPAHPRPIGGAQMNSARPVVSKTTIDNSITGFLAKNDHAGDKQTNGKTDFLWHKTNLLLPRRHPKHFDETRQFIDEPGYPASSRSSTAASYPAAKGYPAATNYAPPQPTTPRRSSLSPPQPSTSPQPTTPPQAHYFADPDLLPGVNAFTNSPTFLPCAKPSASEGP
jgi:hypothetical protein